ncbi:hypothetical protein M433DRAFT_222054 [Acidomyces richmondensis BFW]|nr:hypothetical protein M433DRAFT_222054 [Acidomyces richmondensis BFW]
MIWSWSGILTAISTSKIGREYRNHHYSEEMSRTEIAKEHDFAESMVAFLREPITMTGPSIPESSYKHPLKAASNGSRPSMSPSFVSFETHREISPQKCLNRSDSSAISEELEPDFPTTALILKQQCNAKSLISTPSLSSNSETTSMNSSAHKNSRSLKSQASLSSNSEIASMDSKTYNNSKSLMSQTSLSSIFGTASIGSNEDNWTGVGRFRHHIDATPAFLKEKLENDTRAPGAFNFFGPNTKLGPHPLATSVDFTNARDSLRYKFRTESSTTISDDGCIIQKGFEIPRNSALSLASAKQISDLVAEKKVAKASKSRADSKSIATAEHPHCVTWDERTINPQDSGVSGIAAATKEQPRRLNEQPPFIAYATPQPPYEMIERAFKIAAEDDVENAIDSDDESGYEPMLCLRKLSSSKSVSLPQKSILKKTTPPAQATQATVNADYIAIKYQERFVRSSCRSMNFQNKRSLNGPARYGDSTRRFAPRAR